MAEPRPEVRDHQRRVTSLPKLTVEPIPAHGLAAFTAEVQRFLRVCGCDADTAADLVQEALLLAVQKDVSLPGPAAARTWLRRTARLLLLEESRRQRRRLPAIDPALVDAAERHFAAVDEAEWLDALRDCTKRLAGRAAHALQVVYRDGASHGEAARTLGLSRDGLKTLLRRTRAALRRCLEEKLPWLQSTTK